MRGARQSLAFLTRLPVAAGGEEARGILAWFWLPGVLYGAVWMAARWTAHFLPASVAALAAVAGEALLSGAFHWDGWADVFDAWAAGPEHRQAARRDSRLGAVGAVFLGLGLAGMMILFRATVARMPVAPALLAPLMARAVMAAGLASQPVEPASHLARWLKASAQGRDAAVTLAVAIGLALLLLGVRGLLLTAGVAVVVAGFWFWTRRLFGGLNGDVLGATAILTELTWMLGLLWGGH
ncbi:MAG: adenosylcobinamide-GDP ribazoletransferase [Thermaerobacter sp.]|nr:adenosylcobinamide-GDP ribazoletransferase [Thermaerobacter sp.]